MKLWYENQIPAVDIALRTGCSCVDCETFDQKTPCMLCDCLSRECMKALAKKISAIKCIEGPNEDWVNKAIKDSKLKAIASCDPLNKPNPMNSNRVFKDEFDAVPLTSYEIAIISGCSALNHKDFEKGGRLDGALCDCNGNGEFVICKDNKKDDKVYMQCRKCGGYTHL